MTDYPIGKTFCTICGKEVYIDRTQIFVDEVNSFSSENRYCSGHPEKVLVNRAHRRNKKKGGYNANWKN